jgi:exonuclease III
VLAGVHVPCDGRDSGRVAFFRSLVGAARSRAGEDYVLIGDFNAGRHRLDEEGATFSCVRFLGELATMGYADAWRTLHPEGREYTWYSHTGSGFRIDHAFVSPGLAPRLRSCWYSHQERELGLSDHSAMVVCLERAAGA